MDSVFEPIFELVIEVIIFLALVAIGMFVYKRVMASSDRILSSGEVLPEDEIHTLKQVFYLILMSLAFADILYTLITTENGIIYFVIFDIALSVFLAVTLDKSSLKGKLILFLLVPFYSLNWLLDGQLLVSYVGLIHIFVFVYFIKIYYDKFREYTESNGLSITILILFIIVFLSFMVTQVVEGVNPLDSLVMVSNAFTSNGYAVLGTTIAGKLNAIVLVWGGYILSGVGTATLTAAILIQHFSNKFDETEKSNRELEESIRELQESNKRLEELIKSNLNSKADDEDS